MVANASEVAHSVTSAAATVSARKIRANRRNAKRSTGPRTETGKAIASRNALVHGAYCADHVLLPGEPRAQFLLLRDDFVRSLKPADAVELMLVERIAISQWKILRLQKHEQYLYEGELFEVRQESQQCMAEFAQALEDSTDERKARAARVNLEMIENDAIPVEWIQARQAAGETAEQLERLSRLQQRLEASIDKAMRELERLRAGRWRRGEKDEPDPESILTLRYQLDRDDLLEISAAEANQAKRTAHKLQTVRNEANVAGETDKLRVEQGLEEDQDEPTEVLTAIHRGGDETGKGASL